MDDNTLAAIMLFVFWGWIPILAIAKAVSWIGLSVKDSNKKN